MKLHHLLDGGRENFRFKNFPVHLFSGDVRKFLCFRLEISARINQALNRRESREESSGKIFFFRRVKEVNKTELERSRHL